MLQWVEQKSNGAFGTAVIVPTAEEKGYAEDKLNTLMLAKVVRDLCELLGYKPPAEEEQPAPVA